MLLMLANYASSTAPGRFSAEPEVTAGGIFGDLLRLSAYLGARL